MKKNAGLLISFAVLLTIGVVVYLTACLYHMYNFPFVSFLVSTESSFGDYRESEISYMIYDGKISYFRGAISNPKDIEPKYYDIVQEKKLIEESNELTLRERYKLWQTIKKISHKDFEASGDPSEQGYATHPFFFQVTVGDSSTAFIIDVPDYKKNRYRSKGTGNRDFMRLIAEMMMICPVSEEVCVSELSELSDWLKKYKGRVVRQKPSGFLDW